jgi:hypothetical protein
MASDLKIPHFPKRRTERPAVFVWESFNGEQMASSPHPDEFIVIHDDDAIGKEPRHFCR